MKKDLLDVASVALTLLVNRGIITQEELENAKVGGMMASKNC